MRGINLFIAVLVLIAFAEPAYAYLDAGTGSQVMQILVASLIGGLFSIKIIFRKIKQIFDRFKAKKDGN